MDLNLKFGSLETDENDLEQKLERNSLCPKLEDCRTKYHINCYIKHYEQCDIYRKLIEEKT